MNKQTAIQTEDIDRIINNPPPTTPKGINHQLTVDLKKKGLSNGQIGKIQGCSAANISMVLQRYGGVEQETEDYKAHRADIFANLQHRLISSITQDDIKKTPTGSRILAVAQLYDKERLERGLSTQNIDSQAVSVHISQLSSELAKIRERRLKLQGEKTDV